MRSFIVEDNQKIINTRLKIGCWSRVVELLAPGWEDDKASLY